MLRQGLVTSITELTKLISNLRDELKNEKYLLSNTDILDINFIVPIINNQPKCSDTWELEQQKEGIIKK